MTGLGVDFEKIRLEQETGNDRMNEIIKDLNDHEEMDLPAPFGRTLISQHDLQGSSNQADSELGRGAYGSVYKVVLRSGSGDVFKMAVKKVPIKMNSGNEGQDDYQVLKREMCIRDMKNQFCVDYYGTIFYDGHIHICMEILASGR